MEKDIAPEIYQKIKADFDKAVSKDVKITRILERIKVGTATHEDTQKYAIAIGDHAADALKNNLTADVLPDGKMYYNIATRTIEPVLKDNYDLVCDVAEQVQNNLNKEAGIGLKSVKAELNSDRISGIINKISAADDFEEAAWMLDEPIKNFTQNVADDFMHENALFQAKTGLYSKIIRKTYGKCCDWCESLAGEYEYGDEPQDVYRRHAHCRCLVTMAPLGGGRQNVHTKRWFASQEAAERIEKSKLRLSQKTNSKADTQKRLAKLTLPR